MGWGTHDDSSRVVEREDVTVPFGTFDGSFRVDRLANGAVNYLLHTDTWLVNKVGMVKLRLIIFSLGPAAHETWELLSYEVRP